MGQRADGKYGGPDGESYTKYGEKTSKYGHWEVGSAYAGTNPNGEKWQNQTMKWVEDDRNAWDMDYKDLRSGNFEGSPQQTSASNENDPSPTDPALAPNSLQQNAQQFIQRNQQSDTPDYNTSSQDFLKSYTQDFDARNSAEGEKSASNLNFDLPNNVETTDNNDFASGTFDPVNKADEAAQNFLANKKNLILNNFR